MRNLVEAASASRPVLWLVTADLAHAPNHQIGNVGKHDPHGSIETHEGQGDGSGRIGSDEHPHRRQRDFGAGAEIHGSRRVSSSELVAAIIGALDWIYSKPAVLQ